MRWEVVSKPASVQTKEEEAQPSRLLLQGRMSIYKQPGKRPNQDPRAQVPNAKQAQPLNSFQVTVAQCKSRPGRPVALDLLTGLIAVSATDPGAISLGLLPTFLTLRFVCHVHELPRWNETSSPVNKRSTNLRR